MTLWLTGWTVGGVFMIRELGGNLASLFSTGLAGGSLVDAGGSALFLLMWGFFEVIVLGLLFTLFFATEKLSLSDSELRHRPPTFASRQRERVDLPSDAILQERLGFSQLSFELGRIQPG